MNKAINWDIDTRQLMLSWGELNSGTCQFDLGHEFLIQECTDCGALNLAYLDTTGTEICRCGIGTFADESPTEMYQAIVEITENWKPLISDEKIEEVLAEMRTWFCMWEV